MIKVNFKQPKYNLPVGHLRALMRPDILRDADLRGR